MTAAERKPTHAGGVVVRDARTDREYLLVRPSSGRDEWVLPKGHVEPGERTEETAVREIAEEAGVVATVEVPLGVFEQNARTGPALVAWYLMRFVRPVAEGTPREARETAWFPFEAAVARASFESARDLVRAAEARLKNTGPRSGR